MRSALIGMAGLVLALAGGRDGGASEGDPLRAYRGTRRVLVLSAPNADDPRLGAQRQALASARPGLTERDLLVVEAIGPGSQASSLRRALDLPAGAFRAVLVGKDGGAKLTSPEPIPPQALFSTIDAMPMRRDEMRSQR
ncbi:DUF4174 domain-containing protein [Methylobacterium trifolii]|uniref:DUF4174 domain-containing protein n=1 Tax=Methylobacterium trifolii TaxID=1003092 RepID=A0ABQ4U7X0_9HYPH|nr:DUF4174 domain-containing protein [Methylobacterium trifolii]GJE62483.1 hypothetical protein MPOCJGCO_4616 [Methylobacterium trifolii]